MNLITFQVIGVLIGGRIGYLLLYQGEKISRRPSFNHSGMGRWHG